MSAKQKKNYISNVLEYLNTTMGRRFEVGQRNGCNPIGTGISSVIAGLSLSELYYYVQGMDRMFHIGGAL